MNSALKILDIAERRIRQVGYNAVSYRDIAAEMGLKSASLHYHFPKKEDLGVALVRRYADKFKDQLATSICDTASPQELIRAFVDVYSNALKKQQLLCLCLVLAAEADGLPPQVTAEVRKFFAENISWLAARFEALNFERPTDEANTMFASLQGAIVISATCDDYGAFGAVVKSIEEKMVA